MVFKDPDIRTCCHDLDTEISTEFSTTEMTNSWHYSEANIKASLRVKLPTPDDISQTVATV
ncbi:hypothetical protein N7449_012168 [Penicillium cf. viridicatum]|uniref:Uncharacterized protein n=1 Tax=Penicillium cf. viridicatum TaxID=2972119 RepID=A0A9W9LXT3_9EURO|nr:hypothetical protein N7449_012168 [Penicillium cf. viridicatum]